MARWSRFDPTNLDLTNFDLTNVDLEAVVRAGVDGTSHVTSAIIAEAAELLKDATYVTVGATLLSVQRAQVRRRELERMLRR